MDKGKESKISLRLFSLLGYLIENHIIGISIDPYFNYGRPETKYEKMAEQRLFNHDLYPENIDNR